MRGRGEAPPSHKNTYRILKEVFFTSFSLVGGWVGKPDTPQKNTSFALGMRRACVSMVRTAPKR